MRFNVHNQQLYDKQMQLIGAQGNPVLHHDNWESEGPQNGPMMMGGQRAHHS